MPTYRWLATLALLTGMIGAQTPPAATPGAKADYSKEAAVVEEMFSRFSYENDGKSTREQTSRVRVQTDAGIQEWGLLSFPFQAATQTVEIEYVRVRKPDGTVIVTPPDNVQDLDAEITRSAPFYSDLREKHVAVKGLSAGDVLEYKAHWQTTKPLAPGQFWLEYNFSEGEIVLRERLEIAVPADRTVHVKSAKGAATVSSEGGLKVYAWTHSQLDNAGSHDREEKVATAAANGRRPPPDVQMSSFKDWAEVGRWYGDLQKERIEPSAAIRQKAEELTRGLTTDDARLQALYGFVSTHYRYIGVAFGIGRYQPHSADDVLGNSYGDCKDKHTLLASLLKASGFTIYPALVNSGQLIDPDVPSPAQFDHVVGYLPRGAGGKEGVWLDTTPEVSPFGHLLPTLRDKQALVVGDTSIGLVPTPAHSSVPDREEFHVDAQLHDDGTLDATIEDTSQGDGGVVLRSAFRRVPQPKWNELVQQISYGLNFAGTVSDVKVAPVEAINDPFHFSYSYDRKDYPTWKADRQFMVPGLPFGMPPLRENAVNPVWLGERHETISNTTIKMPEGFTPEVPPSVDAVYDFAEYHASYSVQGATLSAKRRMVVKADSVQPADFEKYRALVKKVSGDTFQYVQTQSKESQSSASGMRDVTGQGGSARSELDMMKVIARLPDSDSREAGELENEGRRRMSEANVAGAISSLKQAVEKDPKFVRAWVLLGVFRFMQKDLEGGKEAMRKAAALVPQERAIPKLLGYGLIGDGKYADAVPVWQDYMKAFPDDVDGGLNLGTCLLRLGRPAEAAAAFEASLKIKPDVPGTVIRLGSAYLEAGDREKAESAFGRLAGLNPGPEDFNNAAYEMANHELQIPLALDYAKRAVESVENDSTAIQLDQLTINDVRKASSLTAYWDTMGWALERNSDLDAAERYLRAAWQQTQDGVVAGHLCHLYRRQHKVSLAIEMCENAVSRIPLSGSISLNEYQVELSAAQENLKHLKGSAATPTDSVGSVNRAIRERTFKMPPFLRGTESAEFFVLLEADPKTRSFKATDAKFVSGSNKLKAEGGRLKAIDFHMVAPDFKAARIVRRGVLGCYPYGGCSLVLYEPSTVQSVN